MRSVLAVSLAFAAGCIPSARVMAALAGPEAREKLAGLNPGSSSINRILGQKAAAAVFAADALKALLPVLWGRASGASETALEVLAVAPAVAHITVVGGRGGAAVAGGLSALDPVALVLLTPAWVIPALKKDNARGVLVTAVLYPVIRGFLRRSEARFWMATLIPATLIYARLRGPGWRTAPLSPSLLWRRLIYDAELPGAGPSE